MSEKTFTFCDKCNPQMGRPDDGRGWAEWTTDECVDQLDWIVTDGKAICPECQDDQEESATATVVQKQ